MNNLQTKFLALFFALVGIMGLVSAQTNYSIKDKPSIKISGTSTLHDWDMNSSTGNCNAVITLNAALQMTAVNSIVFTTQVNDLKSKHTSMDNNAYKALKKDKNPTISFVMIPGSATITNVGNGSYSVKCKGKLTIAGTTLDTDLSATCKVNADKTITVTGTKAIDMKQYNVEPPSFMMGTVTTGKNITLTFSLTLK